MCLLGLGGIQSVVLSLPFEFLVSLYHMQSYLNKIYCPSQSTYKSRVVRNTTGTLIKECDMAAIPVKGSKLVGKLNNKLANHVRTKSNEFFWCDTRNGGW